MKNLNLKNLLILIVVLVIINFGVGLLVSPSLSSFVIAKINEYAGSKLYIEKANIWPLTLSLSLKNLKVFDPDKPEQRIIAVGKASAYLSPLGLLSKRFVLSSLSMDNAEINLEGQPDGTFNIQKLAQPQKAQVKKEGPGFELTKEKLDWFGKAYGLLKDNLSKDALEKQKAKQQEAKKVTKDVTEFAKGRRVHFKTQAERYLFEIKKLEINNAYINLKSQDGRSVEIDKARIVLGNVGYDPELGWRYGKFNIAGNIKSQGVSAGSLEALFLKTFDRKGQRTEFDINLKDVNLIAAAFIYEDSLPVTVQKGFLNLISKTVIINDNIDSKNQLSLRDHALMPKPGVESSSKFASVPMICEILNSTNPLKLEFEIGGTLEKPEFRNFMKSLMGIIMPNSKNIGNIIKSEALDALSRFLEKKSAKNEAQGASSQDAGKESGSKDVINSLQSIFGGKKQDSAQ